MQIARDKCFAGASTRLLSASIALGAAFVVLAGDAWAQNAQSPPTVQSVQATSTQSAPPKTQAAQSQQAALSPQTAQGEQAAQTPQGEQTQQVAQSAQAAQVEQTAQNAQVAEAQQAAARPIVPPPSYQQLVAGLLVRTRFSVEAGPNRRVEVWDLLIGPGMRSDATLLPAGAVIEVRGGSGQIVMGDRSQELRPGATLAVPDRTSVQFVNGRNDLGLAIRATLIIGRRS